MTAEYANEGTSYFVCDKCEKPCDWYVPDNKVNAHKPFEKECDVCNDYRGNPPPHVCDKIAPTQTPEDWAVKEVENLMMYRGAMPEEGKLRDIIDKVVFQTIGAERERVLKKWPKKKIGRKGMENYIDDFDRGYNQGLSDARKIIKGN